jgi:hypothetical protein
MGNGWSKYVNESNVACASAGAAECLVLAYNERALFTGKSTFTERPLISAMNSGFCASFETALNTMIPYFGKIVLGAYVPYTVESIYAELEETRITVNSSRFNRFPRLWFEQVIRVINKLIQLPIVNISPTFTGNGQYANYGGPGDPGTDVFLIDAAIENSNTIDSINNTYLHPFGSPFHYTGIGHWDINGGVRADVFSTNFSSAVAITGLIPIRNTTQFLDFYVNAVAIGQFNAGNSGFVEGNQIWKSNIETVISGSGEFALPFPLDGESLSNFPKYPTTQPSGYSRYGTCGYALLFAYSLKSNFEFIAGS